MVQVRLLSESPSTDDRKICEFLSRENITSTGNCSLLSRKRMEDFRRLGAVGALLLSSGDEERIIGTIFCLPLRVDGRLYGCTTFLCLAKEHQGFGYTRLLRKALADAAGKAGILQGYHTTNRPLSENSLQLQAWFRKIGPNGESLRKGLRVARAGEESFELYQRFIEIAPAKSMNYTPSLEEFKTWTECYPSFIVYSGKTPTAFFSINTFPARILEEKEEKRVVVNQLCLLHGMVEHALAGAISIAEGDLLIGYLAGGLTEQTIRKEGCLLSTDRPWLSLYNDKRKIRKENIHVPLV